MHDEDIRYTNVSAYLLNAVSRPVSTMGHLSLGEFSNLQRLVDGKYVPYNELVRVAKNLGWMED